MDPKKYKFQSEWALRHIAIGRDEGRVEGRVEGEALATLKLAERLLVRRIGMLGANVQARLDTLPRETLEDLVEASLDFTSAADLDTWLAGR